MKELLPFVAGNVIILSVDLVSFVAESVDKYLKPVGTLEDVSLAIWFQALGVINRLVLFND